ncbi:MAG: hypothetical protein ACK4UV_00745 [Ignavibacterium sp.]
MECRGKFICSWCNQPSTIIWVHGHGQCSVCGYNIDECCRGENIQHINSTEKEEKEENSDDKN